MCHKVVFSLIFLDDYRKFSKASLSKNKQHAISNRKPTLSESIQIWKFFPSYTIITSKFGSSIFIIYMSYDIVKIYNYLENILTNLNNNILSYNWIPNEKMYLFCDCK